MSDENIVPKETKSEYKVIETNSALALSDWVSRLRNEGWELQGGVSTLLDNDVIIFHQAITRGT